MLVLIFVGAGGLALFGGDFLAGITCLLIAAFPGYVIWRDVHVDDVRLIRSEGLLIIRRFSFRGFDRVRHPLGDLGHAIVANRPLGTLGLAREARVVLVLDRGMDAGQHPLTRNHYRGQGSNRAAQTINSWLQADAPHDGIGP